MLISLTVGKVDAGVAVLLTEDKRLVSSTRLNSIAPMLTAPDRVPLDPPPPLHFLRQHR